MKLTHIVTCLLAYLVVERQHLGYSSSISTRYSPFSLVLDQVCFSSMGEASASSEGHVNHCVYVK